MFVPKEIAKKLKEKGYKEKCFAYYFLNSGELIYNRNPYRGGIFSDCLYSSNSLHEELLGGDIVDAPTIGQVLKWLREEKGIDVLVQRGHITVDSNGKATRYYSSNVYFERRFACTVDNDDQDYLSYEQAALAGIEYVIDNLI